MDSLPLINSPEFMQAAMMTVVRVGGAILGGILVVALMQRGITLLAKRADVPRIVLQPVRKVVQFVGVLLIFTLVCFFFGVNLLPLLVTVMAALAIGFVAVWSVLSNLFCTVILILTQPFQIEDWIELPGDGVKGVVVDLSLLFTTLRDEDGTVYQVPNNLFFQKVIHRKPGKGSIELHEQLRRDEAAG